MRTRGLSCKKFLSPQQASFASPVEAGAELSLQPHAGVAQKLLLAIPGLDIVDVFQRTKGEISCIHR